MFIKPSKPHTPASSAYMHCVTLRNSQTNITTPHHQQTTHETWKIISFSVHCHRSHRRNEIGRFSLAFANDMNFSWHLWYRLIIYYRFLLLATETARHKFRDMFRGVRRRRRRLQNWMQLATTLCVQLWERAERLFNF